jgi:hypothetical protein
MEVSQGVLSEVEDVVKCSEHKPGIINGHDKEESGPVRGTFLDKVDPLPFGGSICVFRVGGKGVGCI